MAKVLRALAVLAEDLRPTPSTPIGTSQLPATPDLGDPTICMVLDITCMHMVHIKIGMHIHTWIRMHLRKKIKHQAYEMVQQTKELAANPDNLTANPRLTRWKSRTDSLKLSSDLTYMLWHVHPSSTHSHLHTQVNKWMTKWFKNRNQIFSGT